MKRGKCLASAMLALTVGGALYAMAPNADRNRRQRLRPFESVAIAHRGLHDNVSLVPENSMAAFQKAIDAGYGIELDVRLTRDGIPVVFHDEDLNRAFGTTKRISDLTYEELKRVPLFQSKETVPLFEDVLSLIDGQVPLIIEIKAEYDVFEICNKVMRKLYGYPGIYCIESFSPFVLKWFKDHEPYVLRGQLSLDFFDPQWEQKKPWSIKFAAKNLMGNVFSRPDFISYEFSCAQNLPLTISRKIFEAKTAAWTVRSVEDLAFAEKYFDIIIFEGFKPERNGKIR